MVKILKRYQNGNYIVTIFDDGTKIRFTEDDYFKPAFAENCDVCITKRCDGGCKFCYENCTPTGKHANLFNINLVSDTDIHIEPAQEWLKNLHPGTELALNGNDLSHPALNPACPWLLIYLQKQGIIVNLTVNQIHFMKNYSVIKDWVDKKYIMGLGVSLRDSSDKEFIKRIQEFPNAVIHTIAGILTQVDIENLAGKRLKLLILGYKSLGRGSLFEQENGEHIFLRKEILKDMLPDLSNLFKVVSFDNLALEQLNVKDLIFKGREQEWEEFYMGNDGEFTFYIDAVNEQYSMHSCVPIKDRKSSVGLSIDEMFHSFHP